MVLYYNHSFASTHNALISLLDFCQIHNTLFHFNSMTFQCLWLWGWARQEKNICVS